MTMRIANFTDAEAEALIGASRGQLRKVTKENRPHVRRWLNAQGFPAAFTAGLSYIELQLAYNDKSGSEQDKLRRKLGEAGEEEQPGLPQIIAGEASPPAIAAPAIGAGNGHDLSPEAKAIAAALEILASKGKGSVDAEEVRAIVAEEVKKIDLPARDLKITIGDRPAVELKERTHPVFDRVLKLALQRGINIMLVGPAGCGKSHLCEQLSRALEAEYGAIHGTAGASESALTGHLLPGDGGKFEYVASEFVRLYEKGKSVFCFDEYDCFDPNMIMVVQGATSNGGIHIAHRREKPYTPRGENVVMIATANTYGTGANPLYVSRNVQDAAAMDRWTMVPMDYDTAFEKDLGTAGGLTEAQMADLWNLRNKVRENQLRRVISTRAFQKAVAMVAAGDSWKTVMATLVEGWTRDEKSKCGITG